MTTFFLNGQNTFGNRGCEAIIRSTATALRRIEQDAIFLVPSNNIARDQRQWLTAEESGVKFVPVYAPRHQRYWVHLQRLPLQFLKSAGWPFPFPNWVTEMVASADAVLSVGGDNYSLDYRLPSLLMGMDQLARDLGKPNVLWGASVGPFEKEPSFLPRIKLHLAGFDTIAVRESVSRGYLVDVLNLTNVTQMIDPAFGLEREPVNVDAFWPSRPSSGVLGLNVSPVIERYSQGGQDIRSEVVAFIRMAVEEYGLNVLLVPHVIPLDGANRNNDANYMAPIRTATADLGGAVSMTPLTLNAAQIKEVISRLRFFIGARTHATIAALSSGVPTISIAYSIKAQGINLDLFGTANAVLPAPEVSCQKLQGRLEYLLENESSLRDVLPKRVLALRRNIDSAAENVIALIDRRGK